MALRTRHGLVSVGQGPVAPEEVETPEATATAAASSASQAPLGTRLLTGVVAGLFENPVTGAFYEKLGDLTGIGPSEFDRQRLAHEVEQMGGAADVGRLLGDLGPDFALGYGSFALGRRAFVKALQLGARGVVPAVRGPGATTLGRIVARSRDFAGSTRPTVKTGLERAVEVFGGATGEGAFGAARAAAESGLFDERGELRPEVPRSAALAFGLTLGFEGGVTLAARRLFRRARAVDPAEALRGFERPGGGREVLTAEIAAQREEIRRQFAVLNRSMRLDEVEGELYDALIENPADFERLIQRQAARGGSKAAAERAVSAARGIRRAEVNIAAAQRVLDDPALINFTSMGPADTSGFRQGLTNLAVKFLRSPEGQIGRQGPTFAKAFSALKQADDVVQVEGAQFEAVVQQLAEQARKALGFSRRAVLSGQRQRSAFLDAGHAWETGGEEGLRRYVAGLGRSQRDADTVVESFQRLDDMMLDMNRVLQRSSVGRAPIPLDGSLGVQRYIPHLSDPLDDASVFASIAERRGEEFAVRVLNSGPGAKRGVLGEVSRTGEKRLGPVDFDRILEGSTRDKLDAGLPLISNPFEAGLQALITGSRRHNYGRVLGKDNDLIEPIVRAVRSEGGNAELAENLLVHIGGTTFYPKYMQDFASVVTGLQTARKLALAVIANMSQTINTATMAGLRPTLRGALAATRGVDRQRLSQALGVHETVIRSIGQPFVDDIGLRSGASRFADFVLRRSGFTFAEKVNRLVAGNTAQVVLRDVVAKGVSGRLRGNTLDASRRMLRDLGLDLDDIVRRVRSEGDDYLRSDAFRDLELSVAFRLAQRTQFIPSKFLKPVAWTHPIWRVVFQFKNFAINQSRFVADQVFSEAAHGNLRPMATYMAISPLAGELIKDTRSLLALRERDAEGLERVQQNFFAAGGLGLFSDTYAAARYGGTRAASAILGPTGGDVAELAVALASADAGGVAGVLATDQPLFDAVVALGAAGLLTTAGIQQYLESLPTEEAEGAPRTVDLGRLQAERAREKLR